MSDARVKPLAFDSAAVAGHDGASGALPTTSPQGDKASPYQALFDSIPQSGLKCDILFLVIKNRLCEEPESVKKMRCVFQFNITKNGKHAATWTSDTRVSLDGDIYRSAPRPGTKADVALTVDDDDWVKIMCGKLNPQRAFMMSKFKIRGNIMLLQKLHTIWFDFRKKGKTPELDLLQDIMLKEDMVPGLKSEAISVEVVQRMVRIPDLCAKIDAIIQVNILQNSVHKTTYSMDLLKGTKPTVRRGEPATKPDAIMSVEDDDLTLVVYGIMKVDEALASGRVKIEGDLEKALRMRIFLEMAPITAKL